MNSHKQPAVVVSEHDYFQHINTNNYCSVRLLLLTGSEFCFVEIGLIEKDIA